MMPQLLTTDATLTPQSSWPFSTLGQTVGIMLLLLLALIAVRWLRKKQGLARCSASSQLQISASLMVGQNQKIVILVLPDCRLVLGISAQHITHLYTLPAAGPGDIPPAASAGGQAFLSQLQTLLAGRGIRK